jgi:hypothetical protein
MIPLSRSGRIGLDLVFAFMVFSGAVATIRQRALMYLVVALTVLEFVADLIVEVNPSLAHVGWNTALKVSGLTILVVMTLRHTFRPGPISVHRVNGRGRRLLAHRADLGFRISIAPGRTSRCDPFPICDCRTSDR